MSRIIYPEHRRSDSGYLDPWLCCLCSVCGSFERAAADELSDEWCGCTPENIRSAVITVLATDEDAVWHQLTDCKIPDHIIGRVVEAIHGLSFRDKRVIEGRR